MITLNESIKVSEAGLSILLSDFENSEIIERGGRIGAMMGYYRAAA